MTIFYGGRDLYEITGALTCPRRKLARRLRRLCPSLGGIAAVLGIAAGVIAFGLGWLGAG